MNRKQFLEWGKAHGVNSATLNWAWLNKSNSVSLAIAEIVHNSGLVHLRTGCQTPKPPPLIDGGLGYWLCSNGSWVWTPWG